MFRLCLLICVLAQTTFLFSQSKFSQRITFDLKDPEPIDSLPYHKYLTLEVINGEAYDTLDFEMRKLLFNSVTKINKKKDKLKQLEAKIQNDTSHTKKKLRIDKKIKKTEAIIAGSVNIDQEKIYLKDGKYSKFLPVLDPNEMYSIRLKGEEKVALSPSEQQKLTLSFLNESLIQTDFEQILEEKLLDVNFFKSKSSYNEALSAITNKFESEYSNYVKRYDKHYSAEPLSDELEFELKQKIALIRDDVHTFYKYLSIQNLSENLNLLDFTRDAESLELYRIKIDTLNDKWVNLDRAVFDSINICRNEPDAKKKSQAFTDIAKKYNLEKIFGKSKDEVSAILEKEDIFLLDKTWIYLGQDTISITGQKTEFQNAQAQLQQDKLSKDLKEIASFYIKESSKDVLVELNYLANTYIFGKSIDDLKGVNFLVNNGALWSPLGGINSFTSINILLNPRQKGYPLAFYKGDFITWLRYRFYVSAGFTSSDVNTLGTIKGPKNGREVSGLLGDKGVLFGAGLQLHDFVSLDFGSMLLKERVNPLSSYERVRISPYFGVSFDINLNDLFNKQ